MLIDQQPKIRLARSLHQVTKIGVAENIANHGPRVTRRISHENAW